MPQESLLAVVSVGYPASLQDWAKAKLGNDKMGNEKANKIRYCFSNSGIMLLVEGADYREHFEMTERK